MGGPWGMVWGLDWVRVWDWEEKHKHMRLHSCASMEWQQLQTKVRCARIPLT